MFLLSAVAAMFGDRLLVDGAVGVAIKARNGLASPAAFNYCPA
jgi:hypothetical protein